MCETVKDHYKGCVPNFVGLSPISLASENNFVKQAIQLGLFPKPLVSLNYKRDQFAEGANRKYCVWRSRHSELPGRRKNIECQKRCSWLVIPGKFFRIFYFKEIFQVIGYTFTYRHHSKTNTVSGSVQTLPVEATITNEEYDILLPSKIYRDLISVAGNSRFCDTQFEMKFQLKDYQGRTAEWTLTEKDLYSEWTDQAGTTTCKLTVSEQSLDDDGKPQEEIVFGKPFFRPGCVLHDLEKRAVTLSSLVVQNGV